MNLEITKAGNTSAACSAETTIGGTGRLFFLIRGINKLD
jgi:hypothetical protein